MTAARAFRDILAQQPDDMARRQLERDAMQHLDGAERLDDAVEAHGDDTRFRHAATFARPRSVSCSASTPAPISPAWSPSGV